MPQSACLSAERRSRRRRHPDNVAVLLEDFDKWLYLSSGTPGQSRRRCRWTRRCATVILSIAQYGGLKDVCAMPNWRDIFLGDGQLVGPVTILLSRPSAPGWRWSAWGLLARRKFGHGHNANELPLVVLIGAGHAQRAESRVPAKSLTALSAYGLHVCSLVAICRMTCGACPSRP